MDTRFLAINAQNAGFVVTTSEVQQSILLAGEEEIGSERISVHKVGRILARMRLRQEPRPGGKGSRRWRVTYQDLERWTGAYSINARENEVEGEYPPDLMAQMELPAHGTRRQLSEEVYGVQPRGAGGDRPGVGAGVLGGGGLGGVVCDPAGGCDREDGSGVVVGGGICHLSTPGVSTTEGAEKRRGKALPAFLPQRAQRIAEAGHSQRFYHRGPQRTAERDDRAPPRAPR